MAVRTGMIHRHVSNQSGISLVEVMISALIAAGISLTVAQISVNLQKGIKGAERSSDWVDLKSSIQRGLASPSTCSRLLSLSSLGLTNGSIASQIPSSGNGLSLGAGLNISSSTSPHVLQPDPVSSTFGSGIRLKKAELRNLVRDAGAAAPRWTADLFVEISTQRNENISQRETYGALTLSHVFPIVFSIENVAAPVPSSAPITSCVGSGNDMSELSEEILARVPKDTWVIGQTAPYDCFASNGAELQACINLPGSAGGPDGTFSRMLVKAGTYNNVRGLILRNGYDFEGAEGRTILNAASSAVSGENSIIVIPSGAYDIRLKGFTMGQLNGAISRAVSVFSGATRIAIEENRFTLSALRKGVYVDSGVDDGSGTGVISALRINKNSFTHVGPSSSAIETIASVRLDRLSVEGNNFVKPAGSESGNSIQLNGTLSNIRVSGNTFSVPGYSAIRITGRQEFVSITDNDIKAREGIAIRGLASPVNMAFVEGVNITGNRIYAAYGGAQGQVMAIRLEDLPESSTAHVISKNSVYASLPPTSGAVSASFAPGTSSVGISVNPVVSVAIAENAITGFWTGVSITQRNFTYNAPSAMGLPQATVSSNAIRMVVIGIDMPPPGVVANNTIVAHSAGILQSSFDSISSTLTGNDILLKRIAGVQSERVTCANSGTYMGSVGICSLAHTIDRVFGNSVSTGSEVVNYASYLRFEASSSAFPLSTKLAVQNQFPRISPNPVPENRVTARTIANVSGQLISGIPSHHVDTRGARCLSGEVLTGGGCRCQGGDYIHFSVASNTDQQWNCLCYETAGGNSYKVPDSVTAVCMRPE